MLIQQLGLEEQFTVQDHRDLGEWGRGKKRGKKRERERGKIPSRKGRDEGKKKGDRKEKRGEKEDRRSEGLLPNCVTLPGLCSSTGSGTKPLLARAFSHATRTVSFAES